jgi:hypothetical protein
MLADAPSRGQHLDQSQSPAPLIQERTVAGAEWPGRLVADGKEDPGVENGEFDRQVRFGVPNAVGDQLTCQ